MPFEYNGLDKLIYHDYRDKATGRTLTAEPGQSYDMEAVDLVQAVPPGDGRWSTPAPDEAPAPEEEAPGSWEPPPAPPPVPSVPPVPDAESDPETDQNEGTE